MITMKPKAHKAGSTLLHVKTTAGCHSLAVDLPEHSAVVEQLAYIQRAPGSSPGVPIGFKRSYPNYIHFCKRPVEIWGVLYLSKNVELK